MAVSRYFPKFKHYGTTILLGTRIRCVIWQHIMGYATYFSTLLKDLGCLEKIDVDKSYSSVGIVRINQLNLNHRVAQTKS